MYEAACIRPSISTKMLEQSMTTKLPLIKTLVTRDSAQRNESKGRPNETWQDSE